MRAKMDATPRHAIESTVQNGITTEGTQCQVSELTGQRAFATLREPVAFGSNVDGTPAGAGTLVHGQSRACVAGIVAPAENLQNPLNYGGWLRFSGGQGIRQKGSIHFSLQTNVRSARQPYAEGRVSVNKIWANSSRFESKCVSSHGAALALLALLAMR